MKLRGKGKSIITKILMGTLILNATASNVLAEEKKGELQDFKNVLDISANPDNLLYGTYSTNKYNNFSDLGAWHGYYLPEVEANNIYGGFAGPVIIAEEYPVNLGDTISKIKITNADNNKVYDLSKAKVSFDYYPGRLEQTYDFSDMKLTLELIFGSNRSALIQTKIENKSKKELNVNLEWVGNIFNEFKEKSDGEVYKLGQTLEGTKTGVQVNFKEIRENFKYMTTDENKFVVTYEGNTKTVVNKNSYITKLNDVVKIPAEKSFETQSVQTYTFTEEELKNEQAKIDDMLINSDKYFKANEERWQKYLDNTFKDVNGVDDNYKNVAVKSIETLTTNWRSSAGSLLHDGVVPSMSYKWFIGMWAWDSWKQAVATAEFDGELAKNNIRALFDYQISKDDKLRPQDSGAIIDAIFYNQDEKRGGEGGNWNERNSKPPLAAWAVWNVYKSTGDEEFLKEMYPKLVEYHNWWYTNRDHDKNGIAEYGGMVHELNNNKEEIILAAAWESGMDNAPRFDVEGYGEGDKGIEVFENKDESGKVLGYSINQESVDLNAYLYAEKGFLKSMADILGNKEESKKYENEAKKVKEYVSQNMFDKESGYFYDLQISEDGLEKKLLSNRGKGPEGWIPLWAKMATKGEADKVIGNMVSEEKFNTLVPFGTSSKDNPSFDPNKYWRGPVWLDQALYGVEALQNYGYHDEAVEASKKMFDNAEGLVDKGPIRENYNPITGEGLHTKNFSWSASAYYLMYKNILNGNQTTAQEGFSIPKENKKTNLIAGIIGTGAVAIVAGITMILKRKKKNIVNEEKKECDKVNS